MRKFNEFCKEFGIELLLPVFNVESKGKIKEELLLRGIIPKTREPHCTLAMPLYDYKPKEDHINDMERLLDELIFPEAEMLIRKLLKIKKQRRKGEMI